MSAGGSTPPLEGWHIRDERYLRSFHFADFRAAMVFVNQMADLAEELNHHPDFEVHYNRVEVTIYTHDLGRRGLTELDHELARRIGALV